MEILCEFIGIDEDLINGDYYVLIINKNFVGDILFKPVPDIQFEYNTLDGFLEDWEF